MNSKIIIVFSPTIIDLNGANGGVSRAVVNISKEYESLGYRVFIYCLNKELGRENSKIVTKMERTIEVFQCGNIINFIKKFWKALKHNDDVELAHIHGCYNVFSEVAIALAYMARVRSILTLHGKFSTGMQLERRVKKSIINKLVLWPVLGLATSVTAMSEEEKNNILKVRSGLNIEVIKNGIDRVTFKERDCSYLGHILFLGYLEKRKNLNFIVDIYSGLRKRGYKGSLIIAGPDSYNYKHEVVSHIFENKVKGVTFVDFVDGSAKAELIKKADFFILPSYGEGHPLVLCESISSCTPVLISQKCNFEEVQVFDCGIEVVGFKEEDWIVAAERILGDAKYKYGYNYKRLQSNMSWEKAAEKYLVCVG
jgi:glycosyltransferase involved in cell wall biosynthesis